MKQVYEKGLNKVLLLMADCAISKNTQGSPCAVHLYHL